MWAIGCIMAELASSRPLFCTKENETAKVRAYKLEMVKCKECEFPKLGRAIPPPPRARARAHTHTHTHPHPHTLTHSLTHSCTTSLTRSLTHSLIHTLMHNLTHTF
jgi:hypothetical protein